MVREGENPKSPICSKPITTTASQATSSHPPDRPDPHDTNSKKRFIIELAGKIARQPLTIPFFYGWGVLTGISSNARKYPHGINMLLTENEHFIGQSVEDKRFQIESTGVSGKHCKIYRRNLTTADVDHPSTSGYSVFLKDTSTNGIYLNWTKLNMSSPEQTMRHGDIISFAAAPEHELAFTYVYREVRWSTSSFQGVAAKRKPEEINSESKRLKGIGLGAPEVPISLDGFQTLRRSNALSLICSKPIPTTASQASSSHPPDRPDPHDTYTKKRSIIELVSKIANEPVINPDPNVWGVLTGLSSNARKWHHGIDMLLTGDEHFIGGLVEDTRFQIESTAVSGKHFKIYRRNHTNADVGHPSTSGYSVFLKDTSANGTYVNWTKLNRSSPERKMFHGEIISLPESPEHELAFAYVYREVRRSTSSFQGVAAKRKPEKIISESKTLKGIGIGAPEGTISLDALRSLQRSNTEFRKQLESRVTTIDTSHNGIRATNERQKSELGKQLESRVTTNDTSRNEIRAADERHKSELRKQLESQVTAIDTSCNEIRATDELHKSELKKQLEIRGTTNDTSRNEIRAAYERHKSVNSF